MLCEGFMMPSKASWCHVRLQLFELLSFEHGGWPWHHALLQLSCCGLAARPQVVAAESQMLAARPQALAALQASVVRSRQRSDKKRGVEISMLRCAVWWRKYSGRYKVLHHKIQWLLNVILGSSQILRSGMVGGDLGLVGSLNNTLPYVSKIKDCLKLQSQIE